MCGLAPLTLCPRLRDVRVRQFSENITALRQSSKRANPCARCCLAYGFVDSDRKPKFSHGFTPFRMRCWIDAPRLSAQPNTPVGDVVVPDPDGHAQPDPNTAA